MKEVIRNGLFPLQMRSRSGPPSLNHCSFPSVVESDKEEKPQRTVVPKEVTPALCSLMSSYGSVSGSESEPEGKVGEASCCFCLWFMLADGSIQHATHCPIQTLVMSVTL